MMPNLLLVRHAEADGIQLDNEGRSRRSAQP